MGRMIYERFLKLCVIVGFGGAGVTLGMIIFGCPYSHVMGFVAVGAVLLGWGSLRVGRFLGLEPPAKNISVDDSKP